MGALAELERWRRRQLEEYQHAQVIDRMDQQRLLDEYQRAQAIDRMDQQNAGLSRLGAILADTGSSIGLIEADLARLLAVTDDALPAIVDHLALVGERLSGIERILASPRETEAWELFRSGSRALTSAVNMSERGSAGLAEDWLEESVADLTRAVETYAHNPRFWFALGLAHARADSYEDSAKAFARCARHAVEESPGLAAQAVLLAAGQFRDADLETEAHALLLKFVPALELCPEIHLNLAAQHGEVHRLPRALELKPLLAATAKAEGVSGLEAAAAEVCGYDDGPVARLRTVEAAVHAVGEVVAELRLEVAGPHPSLSSWRPQASVPCSRPK